MPNLFSNIAEALFFFANPLIVVSLLCVDSVSLSKPNARVLVATIFLLDFSFFFFVCNLRCLKFEPSSYYSWKSSKYFSFC